MEERKMPVATVTTPARADLVVAASILAKRRPRSSSAKRPWDELSNAEACRRIRRWWRRNRLAILRELV